MQDAGAVASVDADWIISADLETQSRTATVDIPYLAENVMAYQDALGLKASALSVFSDIWSMLKITSTTITGL
jgi:hypothetical protein